MELSIIIVAVFCVIDDRRKNPVRLRACRPNHTLFAAKVLTSGVVVGAWGAKKARNASRRSKTRIGLGTHQLQWLGRILLQQDTEV